MSRCHDVTCCVLCRSPSGFEGSPYCSKHFLQCLEDPTFEEFCILCARREWDITLPRLPRDANIPRSLTYKPETLRPLEKPTHVVYMRPITEFAIQRAEERMYGEMAFQNPLRPFGAPRVLYSETSLYQFAGRILRDLEQRAATIQYVFEQLPPAKK